MKADFDDNHHTSSFDNELTFTDVSMSNEEEGVFASLPSPEEVRTSVWADQGIQGSNKGGGKRYLKLVIAAGVIMAIVIGVAIGASSGGGGNGGSDKSKFGATGGTGGASSTNNGGTLVDGGAGANSDTTQGGTVTTNQTVRRSTFDAVVSYMVNSGVSDFTALATSGTPQFRAAVWMAEQDGANEAVPTVGIMSLTGYKYMTRYVMAVFFYSTGGINWEDPLGFMTEKNVCDWNDSFTNDGQNYFRKGVLCEPQANLITALLFGK
jgi:hypothetical protein